MSHGGVPVIWSYVQLLLWSHSPPEDIRRTILFMNHFYMFGIVQSKHTIPKNKFYTPQSEYTSSKEDTCHAQRVHIT